MEHKGSSGFHSLLGQTESFNYPQRVCTVAYRVYRILSLSLYYILLLLLINLSCRPVKQLGLQQNRGKTSSIHAGTPYASRVDITILDCSWPLQIVSFVIHDD